MDFEWDPSKADANRSKHGVTFSEAASVFFDPLAVSGSDPDHSLDEFRYITFGYSSNARLLTVPHPAIQFYSDHQCAPGDES